MRDTTEPFFRTLVTYEVLTHREAFNGDAEYLAADVRNGTASAKLVLRAVEELLPASAGGKLIEHGQDVFFFGLPAVPAPETRTVVFTWSTKLGNCYDCGLPAAFTVDREESSDLRCAVCAANAAARGETIQRIDKEN